MSELHLELSELLEAGVNIWSLEEAYSEATRWGLPLTQAAIETDPKGYLGFLTEWFTNTQDELVVA